MDDGKLLLEIGGDNEATVLRGGILNSRKSFFIIEESISLPPLTEGDIANLSIARSYGVTGIMQPFVRDREDLQQLRAHTNALGWTDCRLYAKIENRQGLSKLPEIMDNCDEIVIARGDLGQALPLWQLPAVQKQIAAACRISHRPFMVATQLLSSMEQNPVPTRAELSDICNAVLDGAASLILTGETAVGKHPIEAIHFLSLTAKEGAEYSQSL